MISAAAAAASAAAEALEAKISREKVGVMGKMGD